MEINSNQSHLLVELCQQRKSKKKHNVKDKNLK